MISEIEGERRHGNGVKKKNIEKRDRKIKILKVCKRIVLENEKTNKEK